MKLKSNGVGQLKTLLLIVRTSSSSGSAANSRPAELLLLRGFPTGNDLSPLLRTKLPCASLRMLIGNGRLSGAVVPQYNLVHPKKPRGIRSFVNNGGQCQGLYFRRRETIEPE